MAATNLYKAVCVFRGLNSFAALYEEVCYILGNTLILDFRGAIVLFELHSE